MKIYLKTCNDAANIEAAVKKEVAIIGNRRFENYGLTEEQYLGSSYAECSYPGGPTGLNGYHAQPDEGYRGCGVYRTGWRDGK